MRKYKNQFNTNFKQSDPLVGTEKFFTPYKTDFLDYYCECEIEDVLNEMERVAVVVVYKYVNQARRSSSNARRI